MFCLSPRSTTATSGPPAGPTSYGSTTDTRPTKSWSSQRGTAAASAAATSASVAPGAPIHARWEPVSRKCRASARDRRHGRVTQQSHQLLGRLQHGGGGVTNNEPGQPRPDRLVVALQPA